VVAARRKYRIEWYVGKTRVKHTTVKAMDMPHARVFAKTRRPNLIAVITPVK
jgi:hypothetical protein